MEEQKNQKEEQSENSVKDIFERYTFPMEDGKYKVDMRGIMVELDRRVRTLEEAMTYMATSYADLIENRKKLILPDNDIKLIS